MVNRFEGTGRPIFTRGEVYSEAASLPSGGGTPRFDRSYEEARQVMNGVLDRTYEAVRALPTTAIVDGTYILGLRINPSFVAKSYYPAALLAGVGWHDAGSRRWRPPTTSDDSTIPIRFGRPFLSAARFIRLTNFARA